MRAMAYPCRLESGLGRFRPLDELEEIAQSVRLILTTRQGERPFRPEFGAGLDRYAFAEMDVTTRNLIRHEVVAALHAWEPRIWNIQVEFRAEPEEGALLVLVSYEVRSLGAAGSQSLRLPVE